MIDHLCVIFMEMAISFVHDVSCMTESKES
jgi:hypothetical protein